MKISFLIDTNIAIQFEEVGASGKIRESFQRLHAVMIENALPFFYHPLSATDLGNDTDPKRRKEMLSRLQKYPKLKSPPVASSEEIKKLFGGVAKSNDEIDCQILYSLFRNCTTYLVTEDEGIHKRARIAKLEGVLYAQQAIDIILARYQPTPVRLPHVNEESAYNLSLDDPFFDSLKSDYRGFEKWFKGICTEQRKCWTVRAVNELAGACIYKHDEKVEFSGIDLPSMKLSTFKVSEHHRGRKFGELLLKMAFNYAVQNKLKAIWVTVLPKYPNLIGFLKNFGFKVHPELKGEELVLYKLFEPPKSLARTDPLAFHITFSPLYYDDEAIEKYVIPIRPNYHDILFPEYASQMSWSEMQSGDSVPGNTIRKVYLSHSKIKEIPPGSLIFFYRSAPDQIICTLGVAESAERFTNLEFLERRVGKRSVYSQRELERMLKKETLVIDFRFVEHREEPLRLTDLIKKRIFNNRPPQTIMRLGDEQYLRVKKLWG